ncbi:C40 family peptidase [Alicyclobacillus fastidiosus]|uniref:NlpC/P60 family protein n=1 Tax=Alicyclobacillus fastidiosus TaxID=392011 RepID=A0ABV5AB89_9BACL|nr:SH3 domain-containing protein [Alicyclobacillus fastidiosus]WEH10542.1 NlpC/P60 family protein [Alicyclobacillus fastidiosus]
MDEQLPGVSVEMLCPQYWMSRCQDGRVYHVDACNKRIAQSGPLYSLTQVAQFPIVKPTRPSEVRFDEQGRAIEDVGWDFIESVSRVRTCSPTPGFAVESTDLRRFAVATPAFQSAADKEFDLIQDTALHTFEPLVVAGESQDGHWLYVYTTTYRGFVAKQSVAVTTWDRFEQLRASTPFVVVTKPFTLSQPQPYDATVSHRWLEFAAVLPLAERQEALGRQHVLGNVCVLLPVRGNDGELMMRPAYVRQADVHVGWLPFKRESCVSMAFTLLHERYGWGGRLGVHDCSSFTRDVYRTMGVELPRDAAVQETALPWRIPFATGLTRRDRCRRLEQLHPGDLLYMPGHTMIYLGSIQGTPYVIHDFAGYVEEGTEIPINQVMVSTLDIQTKSGATYLEKLSSAGAVMVQ